MSGLKNKKSGNLQIIIIFLFIIFIIIYTFSFIIINIQINSLIYPIKQDIYYIAQNAILAMDAEELSYYKYEIDNNKLEYLIESLISKNYNNVKIDELYYNNETNYLNIKLDVVIQPLLFKKIIGENINIKIEENIRVKLMEVSG